MSPKLFSDREVRTWLMAAVAAATFLPASRAAAADAFGEAETLLKSPGTSAILSKYLKDSTGDRQTDAGRTAAANAVRVAGDFLNTPPKGPAVHYAVPAMSGVQRLPDAYPADGAPGAAVAIVAARGEYEPGSFVVCALDDLGKCEFSVGPLKTKDGAQFPAADLDLRLVKVWYRNRNAWFNYFGKDEAEKLGASLGVLRDEFGIHFRFEYNDPRAREIEARLLGGGSYEIYLAPGANMAHTCLLLDVQTGRLSFANLTYDGPEYTGIKTDRPDLYRREHRFSDDRVVNLPSSSPRSAGSIRRWKTSSPRRATSSGLRRFSVAGIGELPGSWTFSPSSSPATGICKPHAQRAQLAAPTRITRASPGSSRRMPQMVPRAQAQSAVRTGSVGGERLPQCGEYRCRISQTAFA